MTDKSESFVHEIEAILSGNIAEKEHFLLKTRYDRRLFAEEIAKFEVSVDVDETAVDPDGRFDL